MWVVVLFDLPIMSAVERGLYIRFRKLLLSLGFELSQKSVYLRWVQSDEAAESCRRQILRQVPKVGHVTILSLTNRTIATASVVKDGELRPPREKPNEFLIF